MSIVKKSFGLLTDGREADLYVLTNASGASVAVTNYGGILVSVNVPDRDGKLGDVVLGHDDISGYQPDYGSLGALIGRCGNRIAKGECEVSGQVLHLAKNSHGHHLHGGVEGFSKKLWDAQPLEGICEDHLVLRYVSVDGEENYPGTLKVMVTYTWTDDNELVIRYEAVSDKDTLCNLTNHTYFNLETEGTVHDHVIEINADTMVESDAELIPTGRMMDVEGTAFDLRNPTRIGDVLAKTEEVEMLRNAGGIDHHFNVNDFEAGMRFAAEIDAPVSGRTMTLFTDMPGFQLYTSCNLNGVKPGKKGVPYGKFAGFCVETQYAPDSVNHPNFPDSILYAGQKYDFTTVFAFGTDNEEA